MRRFQIPTSYGANRFGRRQRLQSTLNRDWQQGRGSTPPMGRSNDHGTLAGISFASRRLASGVCVELRKRIAHKKALGKHGSQGGKDTAFDRERLEASVASHPCEITRAFGSASNLFRKLCIRARLSQTTRLPKEVVKVTTVDCGSSSAMHRQPRHRCREVMAFQKTGQ